jgi:2-octaprenyl-6-methoxyphenol hydroxylase
MEQGFDIVIVGGGLVGASLACALEGGGYRVAQVEATARAAGTAPPSFDERNLALARASVNALEALGVWRHLSAPPAPIRKVHVSSRGDFGAVRLDAADYRLDSFGAVLPARELGAALEARLAQLRDTTVLRPARVRGLACDAGAVRLELEGEGMTASLRARLVVAADGAQSALRGQLGIAVQAHDYAQTLFVASVALGRPHLGVAYERFTSDGPVALLPLAGNRAGSVCTVASDQAGAVAALDEDGYRELLHARFGWRLGRFGRIGRRSAYPIALLRAERLVAPRAVLVGNAAQTLHPVGAQGFNLGLRDALTLAEELAAAGGGDPGAPALLQRHAARRQADRERTIAFSDGLAHAFRSEALPVRALRSLGLLALDRIPGMASGLVAGAMGFRGDVPRLAAGAGP